MMVSTRGRYALRVLVDLAGQDGGRTTVVIAHSLATIRRADHVIVLRDGRVESSGDPKQILSTSDNYLGKVMGRRAVTI